MKTIYSSAASQSNNETRISVLKNTLQQLRLTNIATLDALITHFNRLLELTSADEDYIIKLANVLAPCVLRPKTETSLTMEEKYSYRLIRDLFTHKDDIFQKLKRSSLSPTNSVENRPRAISSDESNRKTNMEARARAIIAAGGKSLVRATSPAPSRGHRGDRSSAGPDTRFPIQTSPLDQRTPRSTRNSLEVPINFDTIPASEPGLSNGANLHSNLNGPEIPQTSATYIPGLDCALDGISVERRNLKKV